jgi:hypothetical protein
LAAHDHDVRDKQRKTKEPGCQNASRKLLLSGPLRSFLLPLPEFRTGPAILPIVRQSISVQLSLVDVVLLDFRSFGHKIDNAAIDCLRCAISMFSEQHPL